MVRRRKKKQYNSRKIKKNVTIHNQGKSKGKQIIIEGLTGLTVNIC